MSGLIGRDRRIRIAVEGCVSPFLQVPCLSLVDYSDAQQRAEYVSLSFENNYL
jgi:hypothetical protein